MATIVSNNNNEVQYDQDDPKNSFQDIEIVLQDDGPHPVVPISYAKEYVEGMYLMLQHHTPDTFVLATNQTYTVRYFTEMAYKAIGVSIEWKGENENEKGIDTATGKEVVRVNPKFFRPCTKDRKTLPYVCREK